MKPTIIQIKDWPQFSKEIKELGYKSWVFRGHSSIDWSLECKLWRELKTLPISPSSYSVREKEILDTFKACAHQFLTHVPDADDVLEWWSLMQHYGAPTRLIDWTYSPYIATFFAIENAVKSDFCVYGLYVANILKHAEQCMGEKADIRSYDFFGKGEPLQFVTLFSPRLRNQRLITQQGVFTVQGVVNMSLEELLKDCPDQPDKDKGKGFVKFVFENNDERFGTYISFLHRMNISNASLFPGIEGFSRSLRLALMNIGSKF